MPRALYQVGKFASATGQRWKLLVLVVATLAVLGLTATFLSLWNGNPAGLPVDVTTFLYMAVALFWFAWWALAIRCPSCNVRVGWHGMNHGSDSAPVARVEKAGVCPRCGFDPLPTDLE